MKALVFGVAGQPLDVPDDANTLTKNLANSPVGLRDVPDPVPLHDDWVVTGPRLTGIRGSDSKQILLDFGEGDTDNAMAAFCSFPQVMGHEVVAEVVAAGSNRSVPDAKTATTACVGASPTATSSRVSTPGCRPTSPADTPN